MTNFDLIQLLNEGVQSVHIECDHDTFVEIQKKLPQTNLITIAFDDGMYEFMKVSKLLNFYKDINHSHVDIYDVMTCLDLHRYAQHKVSQLDTGVKRRLMIAQALLMNPQLILIEDPLANLDNTSAKIIVGAIESMSETTRIITTSPSFRNVCLMPGNLYYSRNETIIPIYESVQNIMPSIQTTNTLVVKSKGNEYVIDIQDIYYAESIDSVTHIYVKNSLIPTQFTLEELETQLQAYQFFRCHRSYLVNIPKVAEIQQWTRNSYVLVLTGQSDVEIPLSKRRYSEFKAVLHSGQ